MEQQIETKEKAPCFDIEKFNENTYETMRVLYLCHFSKVMEENEKLKRPNYLCQWRNVSRYFNLDKKRIVKANSEEEAIKKLLLSCDESFEVIINLYQVVYKHITEDRPAHKFMTKLIVLGLLPETPLEDCSTWYEVMKSMPEFSKKYHEFLIENLHDAVCIFQNFTEFIFMIEKIDNDLIID